MKHSSLAAAGLLALLSMVMTITAAGGTEIKGAPTDINTPEFTWNAMNFPGFYYDIDKNLGTEQLTLRPSESDGSQAILSDLEDASGYKGVVYQTTAQQKNFKFGPWGSYLVIGFLGEPYFAGYSDVTTPAMEDAGTAMPLLYDRSTNKNLMSAEQISRVLIDDNTETYIASDKPLELKEGYALAIKSVNANETRVIVDLLKNGQTIDTKIVQPGIEHSTIADRTYIFRKDIGNTQNIVTIAAHFKNAFHGGNNESDSATVDGIFQISDTPTPIKVDQQFGKLMIRTIDTNAYTITMDNKDYRIVLSRNKDIPLLGDIFIETADQSDTSAENPLRYYIYKSSR